MLTSILFLFFFSPGQPYKQEKTNRSLQSYPCFPRLCMGFSAGFERGRGKVFLGPRGRRCGKGKMGKGKKEREGEKEGEGEGSGGKGVQKKSAIEDPACKPNKFVYSFFSIFLSAFPSPQSLSTSFPPLPTPTPLPQAILQKKTKKTARSLQP